MVTRIELAHVLDTSVRSIDRLEHDEVISPVTRPRRGTPSRFDLAQVIPAVIAHRTQPREAPGEPPRDAYYRAQTALAELKLARDRRELLPRVDVIEDGQATVRALVAALRALAPRLLQAGAIEQAAVPAVEAVVHESLGELASWRTRLELLAAVDDEPAA